MRFPPDAQLPADNPGYQQGVRYTTHAPLTVSDMELHHDKSVHRLRATIDFRFTKKDLVGVFLQDAMELNEDRLALTPPTRECMRTLEVRVWLYGMEATNPPGGTTPAQVDYATRCTERVLNSRLIKVDPRDAQ